MNKKIISGFLMFALAVFSMSSFVSCKDYNEDAYDDLKARLNKEITLREALQQQVDALEAYVKTIKSCQCDLDNRLKDYLTKDEASKTYVTIENYNAAITALNQSITLINNTLGNVDLEKGTVGEQLANLNQLILNVQALAQKALDLAEANKADIAELKKAIEDLQGKYVELDSRLTEVEKKAAELQANYTILESRVTLNETDIKNIYNILDNLNIPDMSKYVTKEELESVRQEALAAAAEAKTLAQDAWNKAVEAWNLANDAMNKANDAMNKANENAGRIDALEAKVGDLEAKFKDYLTKAEFETFKTEYNTKITKIEGRLTTIETKLGTLETLVDKLKQDMLKSMITGIIIQGTECPVTGYLNTPFDVRTNMLATYYGEVMSDVHFPSISTGDYVDASEFWTERNVAVMGINPYDAEGNLDIKDRFVKQIDGSETGNAGTLYLTINPNTVNFAGVTLDMETSQEKASAFKLSPLAYSDRELTFGFTRSANNGFYEAKATLSVEDIDNAKLKVNYRQLEDQAKQLLKEKNKASVLSFGAALLNSLEEVTPAYGVKASWTDATEGTTHNLFSEYALATVAAKPLSYTFMKGYKASLPGEGKIQDLVAEIIDKINIKINLGLPDFLKYKGAITFKDITLPTIDDDMFRITYHKTYSSEDLAGYGELFNEYESGSGETRLYFLVTNVKDGRYALVSKGTDPDGHENYELYIYDPTTKTYHKATASEEADWGAIEFALTVDVDINKTPEIKQTLQDIVDKLNAEYGASSDLAKTITDLLNDIADLGDIDTKINDAIDDAKADIKSTLSSYVTRIYNKLNKWFSIAPNKAMQPILVAKNGDKIGLLSQSKSKPTKVSGALTLFPTSYTLEMLAPAYKEFLAVTDVLKANKKPVDEATAKSMAAEVCGENMMKVIDGDKRCKLNAGQKGYIYEISYTAVDYQGKVVLKRFYVKF